MKKLAILLIPVIFYFGCSKEPMEIDNTEKNFVLDLLDDKENPENHLVNQVQFLVTKALSQSAEDVSLRNSIYSELMGLESHAILVSELTNKYPTLAQSLEDKLRELIVKYNLTHLVSDPEKNLLNQLNDLMFVQGRSYKVDIQIFNHSAQKNNSSSNTPIFAIGESVNDNDEIIAYYEGSNNHFLLSEQMADTISNPLFIIGVNDTNYYPNANSTSGFTGSPDGLRSDIDIIVDQFRINNGYRYENDNYSEVSGFYRIYTPPSTPVEYDEWIDFNPLDVHKDKINTSTLFTIDRDAFGYSFAHQNSNKWAFVGTYEADWYASYKIIFNPCHSGFGLDVDTRRKFSHEYYFGSCGQLNIVFPNVGSNISITNPKCNFVLKRN